MKKRKTPKSTPLPWRRDGSQIAPSPLGCGREYTVYLVGGRDGAHPTMFLSSTVRTKAEAAQFEKNVDLILAAVNGK